jgi:hypothetical protein
VQPHIHFAEEQATAFASAAGGFLKCHDGVFEDRQHKTPERLKSRLIARCAIILAGRDSARSEESIRDIITHSVSLSISPAV